MKNFLLIVLLGLNLTLCYILSKDRHNKEQFVDDFSQNEMYNKYVTELKSQMDTIVLNDYLYGYNSNKLKINFPLLILKISKNNCGSCIQEQILRLQDSNISNILIFAHFETERERYFFNKEFGAMFNIIFMDNNSLIETLDDNNAPYLFIVDDDLSTRLHFIPQRGKNKLTDEYYQLVSKIVEEK